MKLLARTIYAAGVSVTAFTFAICVMWIASATPPPPATAQPVAIAKPHNTTVFGDLAHLQYTATGPLQASFVFPNNGFACPTIAVRFVLSTVRNAGVELAVDGQVIPTTQIGKRVVLVKTGETHYEYFGVVLRPGPNEVVITPLGLDGLRGPSVHATIYGPGAPVSLRARFDHSLVADGRTQRKLLVTALDRWGHPAQPGSVVHVVITSGDAHFAQPQSSSVVAAGTQSAVLPSASPQPSDAPNAPSNPADGATPNDPARVYEATLGVGGGVAIPVVPGMLAGEMRVRLTSGDVEQLAAFFIQPYLRKPFVNGLISVGAGSLPIQVNGNGIADGGGARRARLALFAQGAVGKHSSLTLAYESQNRLNPVSSYGPYVQDPNERPYMTYGDSSTISSDFHSNTRLFARLDSGRSSLMWGDFNAGITDSSGLGAFHELLGGARAQYSLPSGRGKAVVFAAHNTTAYVSSVIPASGLSMLAQPLHANIVVGSDYLTLIAIDRHTGAVVSQTPLSRNIDYTIDYATGVLRFINIPLPFDDHFNPQSVLIQYAYQGPSTASQTTGAELHYDFGRELGTRFQVGYVNDSSGASNFALLSQTLSGNLNGGGWVISHASSRGMLPGTISSTLGTGSGGGALAFSYNRRTGGDQLQLGYAATSAGFSNPFGGLSVPGFTTYRASWSHVDARHDDLTLEMDGQSNHGLGVKDSQRSETLSWRHAINSAASVMLGFSAHSQSNVIAPSLAPNGGPVTSAPSNLSQTQAIAGIDLKASKRVSLTVQRSMTLSGSDQYSTQPAETTAQLNYDMDKRGRLFVRELISASPVASFAQSSSNLTVGAMATRSTAIGIERSIGVGTAVSSEYLLNHTANGEDIYSALGVQQKLTISKHLAGNFFVQSANASGVGTSGFTVSGFSLGYVNDSRVRGGVAFQTRGGYGGGDTINAGLAGQISPNVAAVAAIQQATAAGSTSANDRFSLAYRPMENDRLISLFAWTRLSGAGAVAYGTSTNVLSFEEFWRVGGGVEIAGRAAYKLDGSGLYMAHTALFGLRVRKNVGKRFDLGAEVRALAVPGIAGAHSSDLAAEAGYRIGQGTRAAIGYSFRGGVDPTLTGQQANKGFYFTLTTLVDHLFGWGKSK